MLCGPWEWKLIEEQLSFIIPLGAKPELCHDPITPNDMHSDMTCAWSGALLEAGAMAGAIWSKRMNIATA